MRIGLIAAPWVPVPPKAYGGTEAVVDMLARGFATAGHDVLLAASQESTCPVRRVATVANSEDIQMGAVYIEAQHVIHAYEAMLDCDIVYDHTLTGILYSERFPQLRVVTMSHNGYDEPIQDVYRQVVPRVSIVAISEHQRSVAGEIPITKVIHHGIDASAIPIGKGDGGYFAYLGRMAPWKGPAEAAKIARTAGVPLKIAAKMREIPERRYFREEVQPLLGAGVEFVGELGLRDKFELLGGARALLNPILWDEPFGLAMIEAMACGTPVLTYPRGAAPEITHDGVTGFVCDSTEAMVAAIAKVDELDRRACRRSTETEFSAERSVSEHLKLFKELVD